MLVAGAFGRMSGTDVLLGSDMAGVADAAGANVAGWTIGDRIVSLLFGSWYDGMPPADLGMRLGALDEHGVLSEYVVLDAARIARAVISCAGQDPQPAGAGKRAEKLVNRNHY